MQTFDEFLAVVNCFTLDKIEELRPEFGEDLRAFFTDENAPDLEEDGMSIPEDALAVRRRYEELQTLLHSRQSDITWLYDQVTKIAFEAGVGAT